MSNDLHWVMESCEAEPIIKSIRFPFFRNLEEDLRIDFSYPLTVLVGKNGSNKSSILRALQGCIHKRNIGQYWFSTSLDIIDDGNRSAYIYSYKGNNKKENDDENDNDNDGEKEVLQLRINATTKSNQENYWETSKPLRKYKMMTRDRNGKPIRNEKIVKRVVYLDFRHNMSAFDKFFYSSLDDDTKDNYRKIRKIISVSNNIHKSINGFLKTFKMNGRERILGVNKEIDRKMVEKISFILGKKYNNIHILLHNFFSTYGMSVKGYTIKLYNENFEYSEAFAGSGEFAIVLFVWEIMSLKESSLILLDEPEVSLHPGAQKRLMSFLKEEIKKNKHQVIMATHSPAFLEGLPPDSIKKLTTLDNGKIGLLSQSSFKEEAFLEIGHSSNSRFLFCVEDIAAKILLEFSIKNEKNCCNIDGINIFCAGGSDDILKYKVPDKSCTDEKNNFIFLDRDCLRDWPNSDEISDKELAEKVKECLCGNTPKLLLGDLRAKEKNEALRKILIWGKRNIAYFPDSDPEVSMLKMSYDHKGLFSRDEEMLIAKFYITFLEEDDKKGIAKNFTYEMAKSIFGYDKPSKSDMEGVYRYILKKIPQNHILFTDIGGMVKKLIGYE